MRSVGLTSVIRVRQRDLSCATSANLAILSILVRVSVKVRHAQMLTAKSAYLMVRNTVTNVSMASIGIVVRPFAQILVVSIPTACYAESSATQKSVNSAPETMTTIQRQRNVSISASSTNVMTVLQMRLFARNARQVSGLT